MPKTIRITNVPDELHGKLEARATAAGLSLSKYLLRELAQIAPLPTLDEWMRRVRTRAPEKLRESVAAAIRAERRGR